MVLVHVPDDHRDVTLIHFPRDLYVSIPSKGKNKINAPYAFGGARLLVSTLQDLLGIRVDDAAMLGFEGFKSMTDAVGSVDVRAAEASNTRPYVFTKASCTWTGPWRSRSSASASSSRRATSPAVSDSWRSSRASCSRR